MFRLALILFGGDALIRRWKFFLVIGLLVLAVGLSVLFDLVDGVANIATWALGSILLLLGLGELVVGATHARIRRRLQMLRGLAMWVGASLVLDFPWDNSITSGVLFGAAFLFNGLLRIGGSLLIRYANWRTSCCLGAGYLVMAVLLFTSWPLPDAMNVSFCLGLALLAGGGVLVRGALRLKRLPAGTRLAAIALYQDNRGAAPPALPAPSASATSVPHAVEKARHEPLVVHIWTAVGSVEDRIRLPVFERYIVALSRKGRASSGHTALECGPDLYISHHPRERLSIGAHNVVQEARATPENNRPGRWGHSYSEEAAATRPSTLQIRFRVYNPVYLQAFWNSYREDTTYNFTHRNCSTVVVQAIDAAIEGVFADKPFWPTVLHMLLHPDMWLAGSVRVRAEALAWSPGLVMDYVSAVRSMTYPRHNFRQRLARRWRGRNRPVS
ncbi:MAG: hypothetical protein V4627_20395 [Pseudomonadota bacterium]